MLLVESLTLRGADSGVLTDLSASTLLVGIDKYHRARRLSNGNHTLHLPIRISVISTHLHKVMTAGRKSVEIHEKSRISRKWTFVTEDGEFHGKCHGREIVN